MTAIASTVTGIANCRSRGGRRYSEETIPSRTISVELGCVPLAQPIRSTSNAAAASGNARIQRGCRPHRRLALRTPADSSAPEQAVERLAEQEKGDERHQQVELLAGLEGVPCPRRHEEHGMKKSTRAARPLRHRPPGAAQRFANLAPLGCLLPQ